MTRIIHTADWHLGARLVDCDRAEEQNAFLNWLLDRLSELKPDLLIVAGDIFDSANAPQDALALYYRFLAQLAATVSCRVLILGGNHDSPAALHAPREILSALRIDVFGAAPTEPEAALLELDDALICAVPFLRERDVRQATPGQSFDEVAADIRAGISRHYHRIFAVAAARASGRLLVATGHLTAVGISASPSERAIHIGNLGAVDISCFEGFAYSALGHIHRPQAVGGDERVRYAGSPIPLSFAEANGPKEIRVIDIDSGRLMHRGLAIPAFRPLLRLTSTAKTLLADLRAHEARGEMALEPWVELTITDAHVDLDRQVREASEGLRLKILKLIAGNVTSRNDLEADLLPASTLDDLQPSQVFAERLRREAIGADSEEERELLGTFNELLSRMQENEASA